MAEIGTLGGRTDEEAAFLLSNRVAHAMARVPDFTDLVFQSPPGTLRVDREAARFSAWYGMFPRSQGSEPEKAATFQDSIRRLPEIRAMGFDVVYLVPIHPIGAVNRKGRNNSVTAEPGEPGSPYAIGSALGGHTAIDPELGTLEDFRSFVRAARDHGMEVALDFAIQCAPDHPWLKEHPNWFKRRPDGTMKYAENPPKKYQDIVNVDFDQTDWPSLWTALLDIVRFWVAEGVKIFRVDNPHTKPVPFWQWLIAEVQRTDPDVLFLAEAFTRPKMMHRLAKVGFSQSYTYFTWRNTKDELTQYLTELTRGEQVEYYRPNFFPNTPDILPLFLQQGGRAGFLIRLVLAATLSPAYGIYNSFELCEAEAVPGKEEYLHSEKYQYKVWDWDRPGHIKAEIAAINRLRQASPALRLFDNLRFHESGHGDVLFYSKIAPDRSDAVLIAVTLDPHHIVRTEIEFPLAELGLLPDAAFETRDAFTGDIRRWTGVRHWILLDPETMPALVLHFRPEGLAP
ncbi:MAG: alpha-amylase family glycosyl hydrolase [Aliidongia sp.]